MHLSPFLLDLHNHFSFSFLLRHKLYIALVTHHCNKKMLILKKKNFCPGHRRYATSSGLQYVKPVMKIFYTNKSVNRTVSKKMKAHDYTRFTQSSVCAQLVTSPTERVPGQKFSQIPRKRHKHSNE